MAHYEPCVLCTGTGRVARAVADAAEHNHVKRYLQGMPHYGEEICSKCGGGGAVLVKPMPEETK